METINIINNCNQKIIIENMLIINQYKLLNLCKNIFESEYIKQNNLSNKEIKNFLDEKKFINFEFI